VIYDVLEWVLQQGAEEGEMRDYPTEGKGSARVELTMGREMAARRRCRRRRSGRPARTRGRGEKGRGALAWPVKEKNGRGMKRGAAVTGRHFKRARQGGGDGRVVRCGRQRRLRAAHVRVARDRCRNRGGGGLPVGPWQNNGRRDLNSKKKKLNSI
jgi:hypothetical protein